MTIVDLILIGNAVFKLYIPYLVMFFNSVDNSSKECTQDNADLKIVHDFTNDNIGMLTVELKEFETLCVTLSNKVIYYLMFFSFC